LGVGIATQNGRSGFTKLDILRKITEAVSLSLKHSADPVLLFCGKRAIAEFEEADLEPAHARQARQPAL
jgi:hypothetical protein